LVEHATENRSVGGSIPPLGTILIFSSIKSTFKLSSCAHLDFFASEWVTLGGQSRAKAFSAKVR
jgi:hypothetical protein